MKLKKQFRLYDIYRYVALKYGNFNNDTGYMPYVRGIEQFYCDSKMTLIQVNGHTYIVEEGEEGLREIVRAINKQLGNCAKPGKKIQKQKLNSLYGEYSNIN